MSDTLKSLTFYYPKINKSNSKGVLANHRITRNHQLCNCKSEFIHCHWWWHIFQWWSIKFFNVILAAQTAETVINISETDKCHGPSKHYKYKILNYVWNCSCNRCCVLLKTARLQVRLPENTYCRINCLFWRREHTHSLTHTCSLCCNACLQERSWILITVGECRASTQCKPQTFHGDNRVGLSVTLHNNIISPYALSHTVSQASVMLPPVHYRSDHL